MPESNELLSFMGFALLAIGAPALSFIYLYLFVGLSRKVTVPKIPILSGRNSLSSDVCQGVLAGVCFGAYGLGLFGRLGPTALLPLSILIALLAMLAVGTFAQIFGSGPLEPLLRIFR